MRDALIMGELVVCADVGSTYTKVAVVDVGEGRLVATAAHRTTLAEGVLNGLEAAVAATGVASDEWHVCSSAGGGLRLAVVGYEELVTAEAGHRVGLSAGARVVHVAAGPLDGAGLRGLRAARPDVLLLVGGTDGGDAETVAHNARRIGRSRWRVPVVVAGNADAVAEVRDALPDAVIVDNVLPRIGVLNPGPARAAIREVFLRHVIGGRWGGRFARLVRAATPDAVLTAVELLADDTGGGLVVVDVGGATTDVYSALPPGERPGGHHGRVLGPATQSRTGERPGGHHGRVLGPATQSRTGERLGHHHGRVPGAATQSHPEAERSAEAAGVLARARTVEGDLGVRWNAPGIVAAAATERIAPSRNATTGPIVAAAATERIAPSRNATTGPIVAAAATERIEHSGLLVAAEERAANPGLLAGDGTDLELARIAAMVALRRHARGEPGGRGRRDLREVRLVVGSGGVLRHAPPGRAMRVLADVLADHSGGWPVPRAATTVVDTEYVLAAAGLLAGPHPDAARALLRTHLTAP